MDNNTQEIDNITLLSQQCLTVEEQARSIPISPKEHKLNQILQVAQVIVQARQQVQPLYTRGTATKRLNKWFNIETTDIDAFRDQLRLWKTFEISTTTCASLKPLVVDVVLCTRDLTTNQTLVLTDNWGRKLDITHGAYQHSSPGEILLERWTVSWTPFVAPQDIELPTVYKKAVVVFRSLYTLARLLPIWRLRKKLSRSKLSGSTLRVNCRVHSDQPVLASALDSTEHFPRTSATRQHSLPAIETHAGRLDISVRYQADCNFRVDDSEALLSSQFLTNDQVRELRRPSSYPDKSNGHPERVISAIDTVRDLQETTHSRESLYGSADPRSAFTHSVGRADGRTSSPYINPFKTAVLSASPARESGPPILAVGSLTRTCSTSSIDRAQTRAISTIQGSSKTVESNLYSHASSPRSISREPNSLRRYSSSFGNRSGSFTIRRRSSQVTDSASVHYTGNGNQISTSRHSNRSSNALPEIGNEQEELGMFLRMLENRSSLSARSETGEFHAYAISLVKRTESELLHFHQLQQSHSILTDSLSNATAAGSDSLSSTRAPVGQVSRSPQGTYVTRPAFHTPVVPSRLSKSSVMSHSPSDAIPKTNADYQTTRNNDLYPSSDVQSTQGQMFCSASSQGQTHHEFTRSRRISTARSTARSASPDPTYALERVQISSSRNQVCLPLPLTAGASSRDTRAVVHERTQNTKGEADLEFASPVQPTNNRSDTLGVEEDEIFAFTQ